MNSNWSGRAPRTLNQAFGPYAGETEIVDKDATPVYSAHDVAIMTVSAIGVAVVLVLILSESGGPVPTFADLIKPIAELLTNFWR